MTSPRTLALTAAIAATQWLARAVQPTKNTIYNFTYGLDGAYPYGVLLVSQTRALSGMASGAPPDCGGEPDCGIIFELKPPAAPGGAWTETTVYSFPPFISATGLVLTCINSS